MRINEGKQKIAYFSAEPTRSENGLYVIFAGETLPSPEYYMERNERSGIFWGGVYVFEYYMSGKGYIECADGRYEIGEGDFVFMNAGKSIRYYPDKADPCRKLWVNFTGPYAAAVAGALGMDKAVYTARFDAYPLLCELHSVLAGMTDGDRGDSLDRAAMIITNLFLRLNNRLHKKADTASSEGIGTAGKIKAYIDSFVLPNVTLDDISGYFGIDKNYIIHRFTDEYGISPARYIREKKIETAKIMLTEKKMSVREVSQTLKYSSTQHFSKSFAKATGTSPARYRNAFGKH